MLTTLWLVVARSGSKGLPGKNIRPLRGKPLLAWRIESALNLPGEVWLSTDSEEYAAIGRQYGAQVPFLRPAELASDTASSQDVCLHAMQYAESIGKHFDVICLLQPTNPFVTTQSLQRALNLLEKRRDANGVIAMKKAHPSSWTMQPDAEWLDVLAERFLGKDLRRQAQMKEITPCGGFYFARWEYFKKTKTFYMKNVLSYILDNAEILDIDSEFDLRLCEFYSQLI